MKIAVTSTGNNVESLVDRRFGRCNFFAFYDTESHNLEFEENPNREADSGAGPASVKFVASHDVVKVVSGEFGFKVVPLFKDLGIQMITIKEEKTVGDIINLLDRQ